jgi:hypothetical protein
MYGVKISKKLAPMKPVKGSGLGRQGYSTGLKSRPKYGGAESARSYKSQLKTSKPSEKILVLKQETKRLGS